MKTLSIIRHVKTERPDAYPRDFERELTSRGHKDAATVAALLRTNVKPPIDWIVSSTAVRARQTTEILAAELEMSDEPAWREELYAAEPDTILQVLGQSPVRCEHVALVAHNPGLEELAARLCATAPARVNLTLATMGVAHLSLEIAQWDQIRWGCGRLDLLLRPKLLRASS